MVGELLKIFINIVTPVFSLVLIGYLAGRQWNLEERSLSRASYYVFFPAFVFHTISTAEIELAPMLWLIFYIIVVHLMLAFLAFVVAKLMGHSKKMIAAYVMVAVFGNAGNFGLSLIEFRFGPTAIVPSTVYMLAMMIVAFAVCVGMASWARSGVSITSMLSILKTPGILALFPALFFPLVELEVPLALLRMMGLLERVMIPLMLFTLGVQLVSIPKIKFSLDVITASSIRLLVGPIVAMAVILFFDFTRMEKGVGVLIASMPVAVLVSIIALEYDIVPDFTTICVLFSTIAGLVTLTLLLYIA